MKTAHKVTIIGALIAAIATVVAAWISTSRTNSPTQPATSGVNINKSNVNCATVAGRDINVTGDISGDCGRSEH